MSDIRDRLAAQSEFRRALSRGRFHRLMGRIRRQRWNLMNAQKVMQATACVNERYIGLKTIKIEDIVASEGRSHEFTSDFLPTSNLQEPRWAGVARTLKQSSTLPPIDVLEAGGRYLVRDGNHRVSVARARGQAFIEAVVKSVAQTVAA